MYRREAYPNVLEKMPHTEKHTGKLYLALMHIKVQSCGGRNMDHTQRNMTYIHKDEQLGHSSHTQINRDTQRFEESL